MNKLIISLITLILLTCNANSKKQIEFTTKKLDLPLKILFGKKNTDSTFVYLCFPKRIVYFNKSSTPIKVSRYNINVNQVGTNSKDYRWYKYSDSLIYPKSFKIEPFKTDSIDFYYGFYKTI